MTTRTQPLNCPVCEAELDMHTCMHGPIVEPEPDSISVCAYCASALVFRHDLTFRELSFDDLDRMSDDVARAISRIQMAVQHRLRWTATVH